MKIPTEGINLQKSKFFHEVAQAFEFLSLFHSLEEAKQRDLLQLLAKWKAESIK